MATHPSDTPSQAAARAAARTAARNAAAVTDFFLADADRLDDRTRATLARIVGEVVGGLETAIRRHAARLLSQGGDDAGAERLLGPVGVAMGRIARARALPLDLVEEMVARVRHDLIADALPVTAPGPDEPSLLVRLAAVPDAVVAEAASALLRAESRRRGDGGSSELPAELHHRLAWLVAAAIGASATQDTAVALALAEAARRSIGAYDEGARLDASAGRLALAIDARPHELGSLLVDALGDRRLALFIAVLAQALGLGFTEMRELVIHPDDERLWLALGAAGLEREAIARIGLALADADPRRDVDAFAERLDAIASVDADAARAALASLALPTEYRAALMLVRGA